MLFENVSWLFHPMCVVCEHQLAVLVRSERIQIGLILRTCFQCET